MAEEFSRSVQFGLKLSERIYYGKHSAPHGRRMITMERSSPDTCHLPTAPMMYAVIHEPAMVDNPDVPSYQPYVYGRCEPPAMIPLQVTGPVEMEIECCLDTAFVTVRGTWRVHCVAAMRSCECRVAVPMGEQGSVLGLEVDDGQRSYQTELITVEDTKDAEKVAKAKDGFLLKRRIYTLKIPQVEGGSTLFMKVSWSQKLLYQDGQFQLRVPFSFPAYVNPVGKRAKKKQKILLNINPGIEAEVVCRTYSHPLKKVIGQVGRLGFYYEADVSRWSSSDLFFSYEVSSAFVHGGLLLQPPPLQDIDRREMFCLYLFPDNRQNRKVFRKEVVIIVDASGSMREGPLENAKAALLAALSKLNSDDLFNIIAFSDESRCFSPSMELATKKTIENATNWISINFIPEGGTNILLPITKALEMLAKTKSSVPLIFLITDGAVEDERHICSVVKSQLASRGPISPRISTFGIGPYCNHYFLQMLAEIGRGYYDAAYELDLVNFQLQRLFYIASSLILANITFDTLECLDSVELYPSYIPDLSSASPLIVFGRCSRFFSDSIKASGVLPDMSSFTMDLKVNKSKDTLLSRVSARRRIDILTARAWYSQSKHLEEEVARMSMLTKVPSEYTRIVLVQVDGTKQYSKSVPIKENILFLRNLGVGFGNLAATLENLLPFTELIKLHEFSVFIPKAASRWCSKVVDTCCCMCFIKACSWVNDTCAITLAQLCTALACFECINCCIELCDCDCNL